MTPVELMAIGIAWGAKMRIIMGAEMRTIIHFTRSPWLGVLTMTHLIYSFSGHLSYGIIHWLIVSFCLLLSPSDPIDAVKHIFHSFPGLMLLCNSSSYVVLPEPMDQ